MEVKNTVRQKDLDSLAKNCIYEEFRGKTILVTGATGLIGSELVLSFLTANRLKNLDIKVLALVRNEEKARKIYECVLNDKNLKFVVQDILTPIEYSENKIDYVIHTVSNTASIDFVNKPVETILININGTKNILDYCIKNKIKNFLYLSTMEVYGNIIKDSFIDESVCGEIDSMAVRSSYPLSKKLSENLCISYAEQYNLNVKIARLVQTFGAGIEINDNRVFAQFAKSVIKSENIILYSKGETTRNYCYITDAVLGLLLILLKGKSKEVYNLANMNTNISILEMANLVARRYDILVKNQLDNKERGFNSTIKLSLDTSKLKALGFVPSVNLNEMFDRTIFYLREEISK